MILYKCEILKRGHCRVSRFYDSDEKADWIANFKIAENLAWLRHCFLFDLESMGDGTSITVDDRGDVQVSNNLGILKPGRGDKSGGQALPATERQRRWREKRKAKN